MAVASELVGELAAAENGEEESGEVETGVKTVTAVFTKVYLPTHHN